MKKCLNAQLFGFKRQEKLNKKLRCWPTTETVEGSNYCKLHLMRQEIHADKFGYDRPNTNEPLREDLERKEGASSV